MRGGGIKPLRDLLARYTSLTPPQGVVCAVFVTAVKEVCGISLVESSVTYRVATKTIGLSFAGPRKTEILLNARKILARCKEELGEKSTPRAIV